MEFTAYKQYLYKAVDSVSESQVEQFIQAVFDAYKRQATVFVIGNGGSAANASHFAQDLAKGTCYSMEQQKRIRALSLTDNLAFFSALGNDEGYDQVFVQQLRTYANPGDLLVIISGSGNSPNVLRAAEYAAAHGVTTIGVTGFGGGKLMEIADMAVHVPLNDMCTSESVHSVIFHHVILQLAERVKADQQEK